jgi:hypothetical protein
MTLRSDTRNRLSATTLAAVLALSGGALAACGPADADNKNVASSPSPSHNHVAQADFQAAMRTLWGQHMEWTWATVLAFATDSPALKAELGRLLRNQTDIGNAIAPYYGQDAAKQLSDLLTTHINQAVPVLTAAKAGHKADLDKALEHWYANAQAIADFLAKANPDNWPQATVRDLLKGHIGQTVGYASDIIGGKYAQAVAHYDKAEQHMMHLADTLAAGIIAQNRDKFA